MPGSSFISQNCFNVSSSFSETDMYSEVTFNGSLEFTDPMRTQPKIVLRAIGLPYWPEIFPSSNNDNKISASNKRSMSFGVYYEGSAKGIFLMWDHFPRTISICGVSPVIIRTMKVSTINDGFNWPHGIMVIVDLPLIRVDIVLAKFTFTDEWYRLSIKSDTD